MNSGAQRNHLASGVAEPLEPPASRKTSDAGHKGTVAQQREQRAISNDNESGRVSLDGLVTESSEESFPASDAPSWSPTTAGSPCPDEDAPGCGEKK